MRALIVDDEAPARAKLRTLLAAAHDVELVGEARTGREAVAAIKRSSPDVVFLDIQMPGLDGFAVAEAVASDPAPYIVFVTADDRQALRAFEVGAVDYLLKPFPPERFERVLDRARERHSAVRVRSAEAAPARPFLQRLLVTDQGRAMFIPVQRIDWAAAERNYVQLHCGANRFRLRCSTASLAERLNPAQFLRINRSTIVRLDAVREMQEWSHGDFHVVMQDGTELTLSRRFRPAAFREFGI